MSLVYAVIVSIRDGQWYALQEDGVDSAGRAELVVAIYLLLDAFRSTIERTLSTPGVTPGTGCQVLQADCATYPSTLPGLNEYLQESSKDASHAFLCCLVRHIRLYVEPQHRPRPPGPMVIHVSINQVDVLLRPDAHHVRADIWSADDQVARMNEVILDKNFGPQCRPVMIDEASVDQIMQGLLRGLLELMRASERSMNRTRGEPVEYCLERRVALRIRHEYTQKYQASERHLRQQLNGWTRQQLAVLYCRVMDILSYSTMALAGEEGQRVVSRRLPVPYTGAHMTTLH